MVQYDGTNIPPDVVASLPNYLQVQIPLWHDNLQPDIVASLAVCHTAACITVVVRLYSRRIKGLALWWDDWLILVALAFNFVLLAITATTTYFGTGRHEVVTYLNHPSWIILCIKIQWTGPVFNLPPLMFTKYSLLYFYHRVFSGVSARFKWICIASGLFVTGYGVASILVNILSCIPIQSYWDSSVTVARCTNVNVQWRVIAGINVVTDAAVLILPMPFVWRMKTTLRRKLEISGIFLLGSIVTFTGIIRAYYVGRASFTATVDFPWVNAYPFIWSNVESSVAIVAACLPVMRPVLTKVLYGLLDGKRGRAEAAVAQPRFVTRASVGVRGAHLVTIGGRVIPLGADDPLPGGGTGKRMESSAFTTQDLDAETVYGQEPV